MAKTSSLVQPLTTNEAARFYRVSPITIRRWCLDGRLACRHWADTWMIEPGQPRPDDRRLKANR